MMTSPAARQALLIIILLVAPRRFGLYNQCTRAMIDSILQSKWLHIGSNSLLLRSESCDAEA